MDIKETVDRLIQESGQLNEIVERVNGRAMNLVASAEEATASISLVKDVTGQVESSLKQILED